jgi:polyhydroxyalkanoate synthase
MIKMSVPNFLNFYLNYQDWLYSQNQVINLYGKIYANSYLKAIKKFVQESSDRYLPFIYDDQNKFKTIIDDFYQFYDDWSNTIENDFDVELKKQDFLKVLSNYVDKITNLMADSSSIEKYTGLPLFSMMNFNHQLFDWNYRNMYSKSLCIPKEKRMTPYETVFQKGKVRLLHFLTDGDDKNNNNKGDKQQLLIIYAPINRFHILDLNKQKSVVRNLMSNDIDVYLLDWGFPTSEDDSDITLKVYLDYIDESLSTIIRSKYNHHQPNQEDESKKITVMGYCWGGIMSLIYAALKQENIKKLILMATPVDFSKDNTTVATWSKAVDTDSLVSSWGHFDGSLLDFVFHIRNPPRFISSKYIKFVKDPPSSEFLDTFFDTEQWLHDTPPIPNKLYKKIINDCYKNNLLITSKMKLDDQPDDIKDPNRESESKWNNSNSNTIDIKKIKVPLLSLVADKDSLVSKESSLAINDYIQNNEKELFSIPQGHIALCIGNTAHKELWPKVAWWIKKKN